MSEDKPFKTSGARENFATGSRRDKRAGKGRFDLVPTRALRLLARHYEKGADLYGERNWELGQPFHCYLDSAMRHLTDHLEGKRDEDHLTAAAWNVMCLIETRERIAVGMLPESLDDLPPALPGTPNENKISGTIEESNKLISEISNALNNRGLPVECAPAVRDH